jgi:AraC-like DNA-binding protein
MPLYLNPRSAILLVVFIQAVITALLVFGRGAKNNRQSDRFLAALLFFLAISLTDHLIGFLGFYDKFPVLIFFPFENLFLVTALIYLFCVSLLKQNLVSSKTIRTHLIIPVLYFMAHFSVFLLPAATKQTILDYYYFPFFIYFEALAYYLLSAYYFTHIMRLLKIHKQIANQRYARANTETISWLKYFVGAFILYLSIDFILSAASALFHFNFEQQYIKYLLRALLTGFLSIAGYYFNEQVSLPDGEFENIPEDNLPKNQLLSEKELAITKEKIGGFVKDAKPFLDPELNLNQLAGKLGMSTNLLSYTINAGFGQNFNDFVNTHRVNEVIEKFKNPANNNFTLLSIAFDCGFNSKTTFNRVFKKVTKKSPREYLDAVRPTS